jgi:hypothetical protein
MNPFVFIVGCPRSGTTLLRRMVDAHPLVAIIHETRWIDEWFEERVGLTPEGHVTPELIPLLLDHPRFLKLGIRREDLESLLASGEPVPYSSFITGIFDLYGKAQHKQLVGDKTPRYVRSIHTLHALWPEAKFVHILRDGRDVSISAIYWEKGSAKLVHRFTTWGKKPVTTAAFWWEWHVRLGREAGQSLGPELYHEVSYESLIVRPAEECTRLCRFLGLPYDDAMLRFHEGRTKIKPGYDARRNAKKAWLPVTSGLRDWRSQMSSEDLERFEAAAGELLDELGYERVLPRPSPRALGHASRTHDSFLRDLRARGQKIPEGWRG